MKSNTHPRLLLRAITACFRTIVATLTFFCVSMQVLPCQAQWFGLVLGLSGKHHGASDQSVPDVLYEMVPHVVLPETIQYKPMPTSRSQPNLYAAYTNYPATYIAYPSYSLPYPSEMRSIGQSVYPISGAGHHGSPAPDFSRSVPPAPVAGSPAKTGSEPLKSETKETDSTPEIETEVEDTLENTTTDAPKGISGNIVLAQYAQNVQSGRNTEIVQNPATWNGTHAVRPLGSAEPYDARGVPGLPPQSDSLGPAHMIAAVPQPYHSGNAASDGAAYLINPSPTPPYAPYGASGAESSNVNSPLRQERRDNPHAPTRQQLEEAKRQVQQLLQANPNLQLSAVTLAPDGRIVPLNFDGMTAVSPYPQYRQQQLPHSVGDAGEAGTKRDENANAGGNDGDPNPYRNTDWQSDYVRKMNRYVNQIGVVPQTAPQTPPYGYGYAHSYLQAIPNMPGTYMLVNPYYGAVYGTSGTPPTYAAPQAWPPTFPPQPQQMSQQSSPQQPAMSYMNPQDAPGVSARPNVVPQTPPAVPVTVPRTDLWYAPPVGTVVNPYYPMPNDPAMQRGGNSLQNRRQGEDYKPMRTRLREKRMSKEKELSGAWRAPYYPNDTGMRIPSKDAYPWGYFGAHGGAYQTPNYGGVHDFYFSNTVSPGL